MTRVAITDTIASIHRLWGPCTLYSGGGVDSKKGELKLVLAIFHYWVRVKLCFFCNINLWNRVQVALDKLFFTQHSFI